MDEYKCDVCGSTVASKDRFEMGTKVFCSKPCLNKYRMVYLEELRKEHVREEEERKRKARVITLGAPGRLY